MNTSPTFAVLLENFFTQRLISQRCASPNTIKAYRDTFRLLLQFIYLRSQKQPFSLSLKDVDASVVTAFLEHTETTRSSTPRTRNARLAAIRSFFKYAAFEAPDQSAHIQQVLAIPCKRQQMKLISYLTQSEISALLAAPDQSKWTGRRDHVFLLVAVQTGLRVSELTALTSKNLNLDTGAHISVIGKGRKERCTPILKKTASILTAWLQESKIENSEFVFPSSRGKRLSTDGVQYMLNKYVATAELACPSLKQKRVTPHVLRHTTAMEMLQAGIDRSMIALWLGHESVTTTQIYLHADLSMKRSILEKAKMPESESFGTYLPDDRLLAFLRNL